MAYLFTNHDKYHLHKTLGLLSIINFVLRFYYAIVYGTSFPSFESKIFSCSSVLVHALLPITSLTIPLPEKRNFTSPMIWKEFRLHSILFSCRHVLFTIITILELWPTQSSALIKIEYRGYALILESIIKYLIIIGCIKIASIITEKYGDKEKRTTNAMPYPEKLTEYEITKIKTKIKPALDVLTKKYKLGLWIKDDTAGVGTLTYIRKDNNRFGALGHPISDVDTKVPYNINKGTMHTSKIIGVKKSPGKVIRRSF